MSIRVALHHKTVYNYDRPVGLGPQVIRLRPAPHSRTPVLSYSLKVRPGEHFINWQQDPQSNYLARLVFPEKTRYFSVEVDLVAEMIVINPFDFFLEEYATNYPFEYEPWLAKELRPYLETEPLGPELAAWLRDAAPARPPSASVEGREPLSTVNYLVALNQRLQRDVNYTIRLEPGLQSCEETLARRSGSCRDSAWLLVQIFRRLGIAARFVSGYSIQLMPDLKPLEGPAGPTQDIVDLHAWAEAYLPGAGWLGFDATSGMMTGEGHIPLAATPDPFSAAPITGAVESCEVEFTHEMQVTRIHEDPRVTKPYTEGEWQRIDALGRRIDEDLLAADVRLSMGGEPTFVSIDNMDGAEWNTAALGPEKRLLAGRLIKRLRDRFAPGALIHDAQGKWYPGESLPRWALACYWRRDGVPLWQDPELFAERDRQYGVAPAQARQFAEALAERLGVNPDYVNEAYEDPLHYIHQERQLPINVDPLDNRLDDPEERERLARVFERGLAAPVGYVLPLQRAWGKSGPLWQSSLWMLRARRLYLVPGDSAIGLRLPLPALPWTSPSPIPHVVPLDPLAPRAPLAIPRRMYRMGLSGEPLSQPRSVREQTANPADKTPAPGESAEWVVRTALCVEPKEGRLHVFMPPVSTTEDYLDLLAAVEDTAAHLATPVVIEGYTPPADHRLNCIKVTPDPGVIEVNVHPAFSWSELVETTTALYEEARLCRLGTEKFMLDGRHTGTGGGNHIVIGGPTPADSPLLRRPDLLRSLVAYWLNHPALSYLFSGTFIGPTSQAPRIDETRADSLYELEIAFASIPDPLKDSLAGGFPPPPWLVDRVFRHLLVDVSGNTHRSEFCIDKLYSPDSATGRLGLLELRAFEMPPHARMSLAQQVLLRALVAWFWRAPYGERPIPWGTQLHDRFMLPHFVERDFADVVADLNRFGYPLEKDWFAPHLEFRYPLYGRVNHAGLEIELRQAIEPWYVLGEEPGGGGTVRYVDSSVERLQVKVSGLVADRYVAACNGRRLPLFATGVHGEYVAGVRYRAWQPPSCLHPTIPVHTPLVFDLIDTWSGRSVGGCTYHVAHPGGRNYETFPVNANEAEARRVARFFPIGHTPGPMAIPPAEQNPQFPVTLDLRRPR